MSFPTKQAKKEYDNNYLNYLMQQINNIDKIVAHNANTDLSFQDGQPMDPEAEPTDTRPLAEQMEDDVKQRNQAYKNASKLFDKDTTRIDKFMSRLREMELIVMFNQKFPQLYKELKKKNAFLTDLQVLNMLETLVDNDWPGMRDYFNRQAGNNRNGVDILNAYGGFDDDDTAYADAVTGEDDDAYDPGDQGYFGWGFQSKKQMTVKEKKLQLKLNALLRGVKK